MSEFWKANKRKTASKENPCLFGIQELGQDHMQIISRVICKQEFAKGLRKTGRNWREGGNMGAMEQGYQRMCTQVRMRE